MAADWEEVQLAQVADVTDFVANGSFASLRENVTYLSAPDYAILVRLVDHNAGWKGDFVYVDEHSYRFLKKTSLEVGDVLIANVGANAGTVFRVPAIDARMTLGPNAVRVRPNASVRLDRDFLYFLLSGAEGQHLLRSVTGGSAQPKFNKTDLRRLKVRVPPLDEQRRIARILGTLDDKIELNRRMNETLEEMARALFKSWFVDFDPVRAKAEGRDPGLPKHLADLFPDRFVDSERGEIPEGWKVLPIDDLCDAITSGGTPSRREPAYWEGGTIPWFKTGELHDGPLLNSAETINEAALASSSCKLWPVGTILFALYASPTVGRIGVLTTPGTSNQAAAGLVAKPTYGTPWLRRLLVEARARLQTIAVGAAQQNINLRILKTYRTVVPNDPIAAAYSRLVRPMDQAQATLAMEQQTLADARDTLLVDLVGASSAGQSQGGA